MPSSHSTRRENAGRSLSPRFSLLQNYRSFTHFCSAEAAPAAAAFRKALFAQNPRYHRGFLTFMPSSHSARRENAGRSLSPRFSLRCKTIAHSLIFAPRRRLPPPLLSARHFSLKTRGIAAGFLHLCLPLTLRVAKILLRVPWGMLLPPPSRGPHKMYILRGAPFGLSSPVSLPHRKCFRWGPRN